VIREPTKPRHPCERAPNSAAACLDDEALATALRDEIGFDPLAWGYAGNPRVRGVFGEACGGGAEPGDGINRDGTNGPFVTMRRAEEFADGQRQRGHRAVAFHNGDGYYVRVSQ